MASDLLSDALMRKKESREEEGRTGDRRKGRRERREG